MVLAFGAGALIAAVSYELAVEGLEEGGGGWVALGLGVGALTYYALDGKVAEMSSSGRGKERRGAGGSAGTALALGAFLDGVPEQAVLGIGIATGAGVSVGLLTAIFVSNLPEAIGSASAMRASGREPRQILQLWGGVAIVCALATIVGYALADAASGELKAVINGFAAGALIVMLVDSMIPEAADQGGRAAGLVTALGFAVAAGLATV
jgi:zinc transporter, ZIP family